MSDRKEIDKIVQAAGPEHVATFIAAMMQAFDWEWTKLVQFAADGIQPIYCPHCYASIGEIIRARMDWVKEPGRESESYWRVTGECNVCNGAIRVRVSPYGPAEALPF